MNTDSVARRQQKRLTLRSLIEVLGSTATWPTYIRMMMLNSRPDNKGRFTYWLFLLGNGVNPVLIEEFHETWWGRGGMRISERSELTQFRYVLAQYRLGEKNWSYFDLVDNRRNDLRGRKV